MAYYDKSWDNLTKAEKLDCLRKNRRPCFLKPDVAATCENCCEMACQENTGFDTYESMMSDLPELLYELDHPNEGNNGPGPFEDGGDYGWLSNI